MTGQPMTIDRTVEIIQHAEVVRQKSLCHTMQDGEWAIVTIIELPMYQICAYYSVQRRGCNAQGRVLYDITMWVSNCGPIT